MRTILFTGKGGVGKTSVAAATALRAAKFGHKTIIMSTDSAHSLSDSLELPLSGEIKGVRENLDAIEIIRAIKQLIAEGVSPDDLDETLFSRYLYTAGIPDPDLVIRTGDELRLSNFLIWQTHYSEYYFTPTLWPDFNDAEVEKALEAYSQRKRRYGTLKVEA